MRRVSRWAILVALAIGAAGAQDVVVRHNVPRSVQAGDVIQIAATGPAGATATFQFQGQTQTWPMQEAPAGRYAADYTVRRLDDINDKIVTVTLRLPNGRVLTGTAPNHIGRPVPDSTLPTDIVVNSVDVRPKTWVRTGGTVTITVDGTPHCVVTATAGGLFDKLVLAERQEGRYSGSWTVPARGELTVSKPTAFLRLAQNGRSGVVPIDEFPGVDTVPPVVLATLPFEGESYATKLDTVAFAFYDAGGSDLDMAKSQFVVDGTNVIAQGNMQSGWITSRLNKPLAAGRHQMAITLVDNAGNAAQPVTASFTVGDASTAMAVTHDATRALEPGDTLTVRLTAPTGAKATYSIGAVVTNAPMTETATGEYIGRYTVRRNDKMADLWVVVDVELAGRHMQVRSATQLPGAQRAMTLVAPTFTAPLDGATVQAQTVLRGTATPGAKVEITIDSRALVAGFLETRGDTIKLTAAVNADGQWSTAPVAFERPALAGKTTFTIVAVTVQDAKRSGSTTIKVEL